MPEQDRPAPLVDSHCHLDLTHFDPDRDAVLERARAAGVAWIVIPGIDLHQNRRALDLAAAHTGLYVAVGVHPNDSADFGPATGDELAELARQPKVVALGEIGLDYYWDKVAKAQQWAAFEAQLDLAARLGLPVIIHSRAANADVASVLAAWVGGGVFAASPLAQRPFAGVLHAFSGDQALAEQAYGWNFCLSLGGPVTFQNAKPLHALVPHLRRDRLMLETDAPYLTPHPQRGQRNEPAHVALVCHRLAALYGVDAATLARDSTALAQRFFGVDAAPAREIAAVPLSTSASVA